MMDGERPSEMCRVLFQNKINLRCCASGWFYYRNMLRCTALQTSNPESLCFIWTCEMKFPPHLVLKSENSFLYLCNLSVTSCILTERYKLMQHWIWPSNTAPTGATVLRSEAPTGCQIGIYPSSCLFFFVCVELSGLFTLPVLVYMAPFLCKVVCGALSVLAMFKVVILCSERFC